jgi:hypothetical protein
MILRSFSLLDIKAGFYSPPFFMSHAAQATRAVAELASDNRNQVGRHPADFQLVELGTFDDATGVTENHVPPRPLGLAVAFIQSGQPDALPFMEPSA